MPFFPLFCYRSFSRPWLWILVLFLHVFPFTTSFHSLHFCQSSTVRPQTILKKCYYPATLAIRIVCSFDGGAFFTNHLSQNLPETATPIHTTTWFLPHRPLASHFLPGTFLRRLISPLTSVFSQRSSLFLPFPPPRTKSGPMS